MDPLELATRLSAWPAVGIGLWACRARDPVPWWRVGLAALLVHEAIAFFGVHGGSHARALADTARQVAAVTGRNVGAGLYANYAFSLLWTAVAVAGGAIPPVLRRAWSGLFLFFAVNGAVVFAHGWSRWAGVALFLAWGGGWLLERRAPGREGAAGPGAANGRFTHPELRPQSAAKSASRSPFQNGQSHR